MSACRSFSPVLPIVFIESLVWLKVTHIQMERPVRLDWSVKGYHHFQVRPVPEIELLLIPEPNNPYDPYAISVFMPSLADIPGHLIHRITREPSRRHPQAQLVHQIAGIMSCLCCYVDACTIIS